VQVAPARPRTINYTVVDDRQAAVAREIIKHVIKSDFR